MPRTFQHRSDFSAPSFGNNYFTTGTSSAFPADKSGFAYSKMGAFSASSGFDFGKFGENKNRPQKSESDSRKKTKKSSRAVTSVGCFFLTIGVIVLLLGAMYCIAWKGQSEKKALVEASSEARDAVEEGANKKKEKLEAEMAAWKREMEEENRKQVSALRATQEEMDRELRRKRVELERDHASRVEDLEKKQAEAREELTSLKTDGVATLERKAKAHGQVIDTEAEGHRGALRKIQDEAQEARYQHQALITKKREDFDAAHEDRQEQVRLAMAAATSLRSEIGDKTEEFTAQALREKRDWNETVDAAATKLSGKVTDIEGRFAARGRELEDKATNVMQNVADKVTTDVMQKVAPLEGRVNSLETSCGNSNAEVDRLGNAVAGQRDQISALERANDSLERANISLGQRTEQLESGTAKLQEKVHAQEGGIDELQRDLRTCVTKGEHQELVDQQKALADNQGTFAKQTTVKELHAQINGKDGVLAGLGANLDALQDQNSHLAVAVTGLQQREAQQQAHQLAQQQAAEQQAARMQQQQAWQMQSALGGVMPGPIMQPAQAVYTQYTVGGLTYRGRHPCA